MAFMKWCLAFLLITLLVDCSRAQESPYFVTYDHHLEEPGNLILSTFATMGVPRPPGPGLAPPEIAQRFYVAPYVELEYGVTDRLTSAVYFEGQGTLGQSTILTGWRWENRFRPFKRELRINPVFYIEYENLNEASRIHKEIVGEDPELDEPVSQLRAIWNHELEAKLILSSDVRHWNFAGNFTAGKNVSRGESFEFGYAFGVARPLGTRDSSPHCRFCRSSLTAGFECYGSLGTVSQLGFRDTVHYFAPAFSWKLSPNGTVRFSPAVGMLHDSNRVLLRFGYSYEIHRMPTVGRLFEKH
jgi:hypothetical protein